MRKIFCFIIFIFIISSALAQTKNYSKPEGYDYYLKLLKNSKDSLYNSIIETFDNYIEEHPNEYLVHIERCKLIENAYYDSEEDYNPNSEEAESCKQELKASFPNVPEVMIYEAEYLYEDTGLDYLKLILKDIQTNSGKWANKETWKIYKQLGEIYSDKKLYDNAIKYGELAVANNDTLDLSLFLAKQYNAKSNTKKAIELLESNIDSTDEAWELNQKGKMLLELGSPGKAITAFRLASKDTIEWVDNGDFADALIENGFYAEARIYLIKNLENNWSKSEAHQKLFIYDLSYSSIDSAKASYKELVKDDFWVDPVGIYRLRLFLHAPFLSWSFLDVLRIFLLFGIVLLAFLIPYALVLPIHYAGMHFKNRGMILQPSRFRWGMRHFWFICSFLLLTDLIATLIR